MPLTVLMNYFNEQLQLSARTLSLPEIGFYKASNLFGARFGSLTFGSYFSKILAPDGKHIIGHASETLVRSALGKELLLDEVYASLEDPAHIVQLDRLVRTLHSLNYLQRFSGNGILALSVHPRHIISISSDYGKVFEAILSDCGLGPERVLLHTRLLNGTSLPHFSQALQGYRSRGYQVGLNVYSQQDLDLLSNLDVEPDAVFIHVPEHEQPAFEQSEWDPPLNSLKIFAKAKHFLVANEEEPPPASVGEFDGSLVRYRPSAALSI